MNGDTFIGGFNIGRDVFYCEKCGHIQRTRYIYSTRTFHDGSRDIKCEICGYFPLKSRGDLSMRSSIFSALSHHVNTADKRRELIGKSAKCDNILKRMEEFKDD